ncbi:hypothetical protein HZA55_04035 [Candidatus Poribacteria bacterium]|nr:hypothetical protein [Candidatus Poribacteria bacterium]
MAWNEIAIKISNNIIAPVYLLYGEEEFLVKKYLSILIDLIVPQANKDFNLEFIDASATTPENITTASDTYPFFEGKRVLVIQNHPAFQSSTASFSPIKQGLELFEKGETKKAALLFLSYLELELEDFKNMTRLEFQKLILEKEEESLSNQEIDNIGKIYLYIIEKKEIFSTSKEDAKENAWLENYILNKQPDFSCLIFAVIGKVNKKNALYKAISKKGEIIEFLLDKTDFNFYLEEMKKELKVQGITITSGALKKLIEKTVSNLRQIYKEIDKIISFLGDKKSIEEKDIELLVSRTETEKIYEFSDAMSEKNKDKALTILNHLIKDQIHPLQILAALISRFRFLLQSKLLIAEGIVSNTNSYPHFTQKIYPELKKNGEKLLAPNKSYNLLKQHPFVVFKAIQQSANFSLLELKVFFNNFIEADKKLKLSSNSPQIILELLVIEMLK